MKLPDPLKTALLVLVLAMLVGCFLGAGGR